MLLALVSCQRLDGDLLKYEDEREAIITSVWPNPTFGQLYVSFEEGGMQRQVRVLAQTGETVWESPVMIPALGVIEVDLTALAPGAYQLIVENPRGYQKRVVIKE